VSGLLLPSWDELAVSRPVLVATMRRDRYPSAAGTLALNLPKRVTPSRQERTVGIAQLGNYQLPPISSGYDSHWSPLAEQRLEAIGVAPDRLKFHVEIKLVAMMIETRQTRAEIAINYTPCGVETQQFRPDTCDKVLDDMLPPGYTLTVYGTTQNNEPFERTYGR
jgi:hypothetical protein